MATGVAIEPPRPPRVQFIRPSSSLSNAAIPSLLNTQVVLLCDAQQVGQAVFFHPILGRSALQGKFQLEFVDKLSQYQNWKVGSMPLKEVEGNSQVDLTR